MQYTIAVDFDGVIHSYTSPWVDHGTIPDPPVPGAIEFLNEMVKHFKVVIFSTRCSTAEGMTEVLYYIKKHGGPDMDRLIPTDVKPAALVYIDDRAWRFEGTFPTKEEIHQAIPWNKKAKAKTKFQTPQEAFAALGREQGSTRWEGGMVYAETDTGNGVFTVDEWIRARDNRRSF